MFAEIFRRNPAFMDKPNKGMEIIRCWKNVIQINLLYYTIVSPQIQEAFFDITPTGPKIPSLINYEIVSKIF
jgi:hypothetical protein